MLISIAIIVATFQWLLAFCAGRENANPEGSGSGSNSRGKVLTPKRSDSPAKIIKSKEPGTIKGDQQQQKKKSRESKEESGSKDGVKESQGSKDSTTLSKEKSGSKEQSGSKERSPSKEVTGSKDKTASKEKSGSKEKDPHVENQRVWALKTSKMKCVDISKAHKDKLKGFQPKDRTYKTCEANQILNRYSDVLCADETRVILKNRKNDYIHASWMNMPDKKTSYILTQGPLKETISDFWAMIYQENVKFVLMLCNLVENGSDKCTLYYPEKKGQKERYGNFEVTNGGQKEEPVEGLIYTMFHVVDIDAKTAKPIDVHHLFVPWWPDQLAPEDPKNMLSLYKWVKSNNPSGIPICVHCSAGVGRTATFVGIDYCNLRIQEDATLDLVDIVREMRAMRYQAIQTHMQFLFLHACMLAYFVDQGIVEKDGAIQAFLEQYAKHASKKLAKKRGPEDNAPA